MTVFPLLFLSGCSDFLSERNETKYSVDYIYSTPDGLKLAVNALYAKQRYYANDNESATMMAMVRMSDLVIPITGIGNYFGLYDPVYFKASSAQVVNRWKIMYSIIGKCNDIIEAARTMEDSPALRATVSEARCFRAQSYFLLYRTYDRIWLNTEAVTAGNIDRKREYHPAPTEDVFKLLYEDLEYAVENLPWTAEPGRFNSAAARHLLADVALWNKDYQKTYDLVAEIDECPDYVLQDVDKVFYGADLNHSEALLTQQWSENLGGNLGTADPVGNYLHALYIAQSRSYIKGKDGEACSVDNWGYTYGRCLPNPYLFSLYPAGDSRYEKWYIHKYRNTSDEEIKGVKPGEYFPSSEESPEKYLLPGCLKYGDIWTRQPFETKGFKDVIIYRLAESYLFGAEAALMLGDMEKARYYFNKTWERAGNSRFEGTLTIKNIIDEQAREMAFEGGRWFFLKRLGILIDQVSNYIGHPGLQDPYGTCAGRENLPANPHFVRWPIPEAEIINMGAENFPQNIGY